MATKNRDEKDSAHPRQTNRELPKKVFAMRDSLLTELFNQSKNFRAVENIAISATIFWLLTNTASDYHAQDSSCTFDVLRSAFANYEIGIFIWTKLMLLTLGFFPIVCFWAKHRGNSYLFTNFDHLFLAVYLAYQGFFISISYDVLFRNPIFGPATATAVSLEQVRLFAKMYAFVREMARKIYTPQESDLKKSDGDATVQQLKSAPEIPTFGWYVYFLFLPTLVYRDAYPRTQSINWSNICQFFATFIGSYSLCYYIFSRYIIPEFNSYLTAESVNTTSVITGGMLLKSLFTGILPASSIYLLMFIGFFEGWLNIWAELLCFGDRLFYKDWWNASNYGEFYRNWNIVVHDWLYNYVYKDSQDIFGKSKAISAVFVFAASSAFHEYVIISILRFFFPVMLVTLSGVGFLLTLKSSKSKGNGANGRFDNLLLWLSIFVGWGNMYALYLFETSARYVCPTPYYENAFLDIIIPRFWSCYL